MTASLYQSGSSAAANSRVDFFSTFIVSHEIIEILFAPDAAADAEDMGGSRVRVKLDVISLAVPEKSGAAHEIMGLIRLARLELQRLDRNLHPAGLRVMRIEVHDDDDHIG